MTPPSPLPENLEDWIVTKDVDDLFNYTGPTGAGFAFNRDLTDDRDRWDFSTEELNSTFGD